MKESKKEPNLVIACLKLETGEDIIATFDLNELEGDGVIVNLFNTFRIIQKVDLKTNNVAVYLVHWNRFSADEEVPYPKDKILCFLNPADDVLYYYQDLSDELEEERKMEQNEKLLEQAGGSEKVFETQADWENWMLLVHSKPSNTLH